MSTFRFGTFIGILLVLVSLSTAHGHVTVACMMAYEEGGAPAVFRSPECLQWNLVGNQTANCQYATLQGYREYQEDRVTCDFNLTMPFLGILHDGVGVAAVFDGHGGKEASEMASKLFLDYFYLHAVFGAYNVPNFASSHLLPALDEESIRGILKEAVLRAIHDIEIEFTSEALKSNYHAGSTATVALFLDGWILVASVGDSKALLCSNRSKGSSGTLYAEELTKDHHPDRADERARIEAAGGFVWVRGVPRVNGLLAVSRAIGDLSLKRYGVIAEPEVLDWRAIEGNDVFLVVASDGIFESLSMKSVCGLLEENSPTCSSSSSLADCITEVALRRGSTDNLSAIERVAPSRDLIVVGARWCFHGPPPFAALLTGTVSAQPLRGIRFRIISEILMGGVKIALLLLGLIVCTIPHSNGLSCKTIYEEGGAPAVFDSPDCDDQIFLTRFLENQTVNCEFSTSQGRRKYQEDRMACNLDLQTPFVGAASFTNYEHNLENLRPIQRSKKLRLNIFAGDNGTENVRVGVVAVFDGHIGKEASEMASRLFLDYFYLHSAFGTYQTKRLLDEEETLISEFRSHAESDLESVEGIVPEMTNEEHQMVILRGALLRTIHDIDAAFTKARGSYEAFKKNLPAGSTAIVALLFDGRILAANVGDSKAFLCSSKKEAEGLTSSAKFSFINSSLINIRTAYGCSKMSSLSAEELTRDHTANIVEERTRIQATGAYIFDGDDVPLIMGHFPMTRAIGDIPLKRFGIIPVPEITEWRPLTVNDSYLVVSSDGIFESLTPQNVCDLIHDENVRGHGQHSLCFSSSVADCIVQRAFENGSMDNLSVVVVPLKSAGFSPAPYEN
ncbi:hypothetical protein RJ640_019696 [Escallonia rubra]|uniref:PPM-type phosphatase domain-containing protein n=1 Tax=Escallonia rubra TaxID=112253 RepID=A0AA88UM30_9ASTE|nr:hypothetical protein RJ640_019696 [Escallonia rubra]